MKVDCGAFTRLDAFQLFEKIDVEVGSAEFAVGDALQAEFFLKAHDIADRLVFDRAQRLGGHSTLLIAIASIQ